jgi:ketosteroid isomerase-like protein
MLSMLPRTISARLLLALSIAVPSAAPLLAQSSPPPPLPLHSRSSSPSSGQAAYDPLAAPSSSGSLLTQPTLSPGALVLMDLERRFAADVAAGGGRAFAAWFADDAVSLSNGQPAALGRRAIAAGANWDAKAYQLSWTPTGAQMGPSNDMGFTWGHYEGHTRDAHGEPVTVTGRYITVWKKLPDGAWKVALDASAAEPPATGDCCTLPKP